jgi:hypothetical protein
MKYQALLLLIVQENKIAVVRGQLIGQRINPGCIIQDAPGCRKNIPLT